MVQTKPQLVSFDGEYEGKDFHGSDRIGSRVFPDLHLTAAQLLNAKD